MTTLRFHSLLDQDIVEATARYSITDYTLTLQGSHISTEASRISIDSLTLHFASHDHSLIGLDAYTNYHRWIRTSLSQHVDRYKGKLISLETFDQHGIAKAVEGTTRYFWDDQANILRIELMQDMPTLQVACLSCLTCGLTDSGNLAELWLQNLIVE